MHQTAHEESRMRGEYARAEMCDASSVNPSSDNQNKQRMSIHASCFFRTENRFVAGAVGSQR